MYTIDLAVAEDGSRYHCASRMTTRLCSALMAMAGFSLPQDSSLIRDMIEQGVVLKIGRAVHRLATE